MTPLRTLTLDEWDVRYRELRESNFPEQPYGGPLSRHLERGDTRLHDLRFDDSLASLRLWNFLLTEEDRLHSARQAGKKIIGAMKDLGTVPVVAFSAPHTVAFYPDGAWWTPCLMMNTDGLLRAADKLGIDDSFCPVRAALGAFELRDRFPLPDLLTCSVGAVCDDMSAIAQRLEALGHPVTWWEVPHRRPPDAIESGVELPGGFTAPECQVHFVEAELARVRDAISDVCRLELTDEMLLEGIRVANHARELVSEIRRLAFAARPPVLPALELLITEMLAVHFCSDREECIEVLTELLEEVRKRASTDTGIGETPEVGVFWVNPVADLRVMNLLEQSGMRLRGTDFMLSHALERIPDDLPPLRALAHCVLADPMVGTVQDRARRILHQIRESACEAVVISRIPGGSHCACEGTVIRDVLTGETDVPIVEVEVPPVCDSLCSSLRTRLEALVETALSRRKK